MHKATVIVVTLMLTVFCAFLSSAHAVPIRVSQESAAGYGDFDANVLGYIESFTTTMTTADFYQYGSPLGASYNGNVNGGPAPVSDQSQFFLLDALDGLSLVVVHDASDATGGKAVTRWNLIDDVFDKVLIDDPNESAIISQNGTQFDSTKNWAPCCTDGYAIGSLDDDWTLFGQFLESPSGIDTWVAASSGGSPIELALAAERRVRLDAAAPVPEPATIFILGTGLVGLAGMGRKKIFNKK